jgi:spore germination cell wall hydrolase CwlJ-like protein
MIATAAFCLALTVYHEARGEPVQGQRMVAEVVMNRAGWRNERVCHVVFANKQFSYTNGKVTKVKGGYSVSTTMRPEDQAAWLRARQTAARVLAHGEQRETTRGATHFHTIHVDPYWRKSYTKVAQVGRHIFYRPA